MSIIQGILSGTIGWVAYVINLILGFLAGILFEIGGSLVQFALDLNNNIIGQPIVIIGWQIVLGLVNLGFVLAIIMIAFATIFRMQSYAMKQTLWKLIVAALLVNFSLVIAGAFINIADIVTNNFQKESNLGPVEAATTLAKAFNIQNLLQAGGGGPTEEICWWRGEGLNLLLTGPKVLGLCSRDPKTGQPEESQWTLKDLHKTCICEKVDSQQKQKMLMAAAREGDELTGPLLSAIASVFFTVAFTLIGAITLLALAIMLIIRFIALGLLLVLSPFALLFWILPSTQNLWQKWWSNFFRWTFFAPAVSFFMFLAVKATQNLIFTNPSSSAVNQAIEGALIQHGAVALIGNMVILLGFLLGGLYVANSLSITFASTAYGWAGSIGKSFGGWAGRKGIQAGTSPLRGKWGVKAIEAIERFGTKEGKPRETRWGKAWQTLTHPIRTQVGERLSGLAAIGAEQAVAEAGKRYEKWDDNRGAKAIYSMNAAERVYWLQRLAKNKNWDLLPDASAFINEKTKAEVVAHGLPPPVYTNMERTVGFSADSLRALREGDFDKKVIDEMTGKAVIDEVTGKEKTERVTLKSAKKAFWRNLRPEHAARLQIDNYFRAEPRFGLSVKEKERMHPEDVEAILETNPDLLANIIRGIKGRNLDNLNRHLFKFMEDQTLAAGKESIKKWLESDPKYKKVLTFFDSSMARNLGINIDVPISGRPAQPFTSA